VLDGEAVVVLAVDGIVMSGLVAADIEQLAESDRSTRPKKSEQHRLLGSAPGRFCSLIPGSGCQALNDSPCRPTVLSR